MLDLRHLGDRLIGSRVAVIVLDVLWHGQPAAQELPAAEQLVEGRPELAAHRAVQDEVDGRVYQG